MSPDELKMIMDAVSAVSGDAASVAKYWIILHYAIKVLTIVAMAGTLCFVVVKVGKLIAGGMDSQRELQWLASDFGIGSYSAWYGPDRMKLRDALKELKDKAAKAPAA